MYADDVVWNVERASLCRSESVMGALVSGPDLARCAPFTIFRTRKESVGSE